MKSHHVNGITNAVIKRMLSEGKTLGEIQDAVPVEPQVVADWVEAIKAKQAGTPAPAADPIAAVAPVEPVKVRKPKK